MLECRAVVTENLSWKIGNGEKASFCYDSWNGENILAQQEGALEIIPIMENVWGEKVEHYVEQITTNLGTTWEWKDVSNLDITQEQKCLMKKIFDSRTIVIREEEDSHLACG